MSAPLRVDRQGPVTVITIDRPERRNAVDRPTADALLAAFTAFDADPEVSVAVLTGSAGTFCAGADLQAIAHGEGNRVGEDGAGPMGPTRLELSKPVIAAVEGHAVAGGLELAIWCDLRVAADDAVFGVFCRRFGVPLVDGGTVRLPRLVGQGRAMDLILSGRGVGADEALAMGLVNVVIEGPDDVVAAARDYAREMARHCAPTSLAMLRHQLQADSQSDFATALSAAYRAMTAAVEGEAFREGLDSFVEGRPPIFPGLPDDYRPELITGRRLPEVDHDPGT